MARATLAALLVALSITTVEASPTLRQAYEDCATNAYLDLLVAGRPPGSLTVEGALAACETEARQLQSLLVSADMEPKIAFSLLMSIRAGIKYRLLTVERPRQK